MSEHRLVILGCGSSGGVPRIGNHWGACDASEPRNRRRRSSVLVQRFGDKGRTTNVLIDSSPDVREQLTGIRIGELDGVLYTHDHADHTHGIDDLRMVAFNMRQRVDIWADARTLGLLRHRFDYCFATPPGGSYPPILNAHTIEPPTPVVVEGAGGPISATPFPQQHGDIVSLGFRVRNVAYSSDISDLPGSSRDLLRDLDVWIVDALRYQPHPSHWSVAQALRAIAEVRPRRAILTHMHVDLDYATLCRELPEGVEPAYDGMVVPIQ
jgi:phosphoribosyl 1,2-cyclic phosphate phosphodiesterase